jgi:hypothetical protein
MDPNSRPPRRFNIIETRVRAKNFRKTNKNYLTQYTRKRSGTQTKLVRNRLARAQTLLAAIHAAPPQRFTQMDVSGDGNCFYRALYRVAKEHKDPSVLNRVFTILGADKSKIRNESDGATALRVAVAAIVAQQVNEPEGIYERLRNAAALPKSERLLFNEIVREAAYGIAPIYRRIRAYTRKKDGKRAFYANLSAAVARNGEYASEADYYMVRDRLEAGGIDVVSTHAMPVAGVRYGKPVLYLRRVNENHYNYWREN